MKQIDMATRIALKELGMTDEEIDALVLKQKSSPSDIDDDSAWPIKMKQPDDDSREAVLQIACTGLMNILTLLQPKVSVAEGKLIARAIDATREALAKTGSASKAKQPSNEGQLASLCTMVVSELRTIVPILDPTLGQQILSLVFRIEEVLLHSPASGQKTVNAIQREIMASLKPGLDAAFKNAIASERQREKAVHKGARLHSVPEWLDIAEEVKSHAS